MRRRTKEEKLTSFKQEVAPHASGLVMVPGLELCPTYEVVACNPVLSRENKWGLKLYNADHEEVCKFVGFRAGRWKKMLKEAKGSKWGNVGSRVMALSDLRIWWPRFKMLASSQHYFCSAIHVHHSLPSVKKTKSGFQSCQGLLFISAFALLRALLPVESCQFPSVPCRASCRPLTVQDTILKARTWWQAMRLSSGIFCIFGKACQELPGSMCLSFIMPAFNMC